MYDLYLDQIWKTGCFYVSQRLSGRGVLVVFGVWFCDNVAHVDDPVGAVAVHCVNGIWGTIAVGLFATNTVPESTINGFFYGGSYFCEYHCFSEIHWI